MIPLCCCSTSPSPDSIRAQRSCFVPSCASGVSAVVLSFSSPIIRTKPGIWLLEWASFELDSGPCWNLEARRSNSSCPGIRSSRVVESLRLALAIAAKDLRAELRSRTSFLSAAMFAALLLVVFNFARDPTAVATIDLAPGILWVTVAFAAVVAMNRGFAVERENHAFDGLLLAPISREVLFLGKYLANLTFVLLVEIIALPLFVLFFNVDLSEALPGLLVTLLLATAGLVSVGTLFSAIVVRTRFAELMLPVLLLPFMVPPLVFAVQITMRLLTGRALSEVAGGLRLLVLYDVAFITVSLLLFSAVVDE